jgi:RNA polymerase sigma-70 factor (ECF subfamily)
VVLVGGRRGDAELAALFRAEYPRLVRALGALVGPDAAADAVQDAFVQAARHWRRIRRYDDPAAWVRRVALHRVASQRRGARRLDAALPRLAEATARSVWPAVSEMSGLLAALPKGQREVVCLYYLADLPVAEIARTLGVAEGTVKSQLHDARVALRLSMEASRDV